MVYIISVDSDVSSSDVIEWLFKFKKSFIRIGNLLDIKQKLDFFPITLSNSTFDNILTNKNKTGSASIWVRRFNGFENIDSPDVQKFYKNESIALADFILQNKFDNRKIIGVSDFGLSVNKLKILSIAQEYGLSIPSSIITNSKVDVYSFRKEFKKIISKPIAEIFFGKQNEKAMISYTKLITKSFIDSLPSTFPSLLFQQYIEKEYELRIFYLDGKLYPMAIFSQNSNQTQVDFRRYNFKNPNRNVPYKLPKTTEERLLRFFKDYKFEAGSVDMVKCKNTGVYYFLEINPHGQFGMVSAPCNYYLEKKIAELL